MHCKAEKKGEPYENLKKCVHVSILDFIHFEDDGECYRQITFCDRKTGKEYTDLMEIQILELQKLSQDQKDGNGLINWMRFLGGKNRREFEEMAKTDEYIGEAYRELEKLSADEKAKLEYEAREKAIRDYNSQMGSALRRGMKKGIETGLKQSALNLKKMGMSEEQIAQAVDRDIDVVKEWIREGEKE